jgi:hypothetical protein
MAEYWAYVRLQYFERARSHFNLSRQTAGEHTHSEATHYSSIDEIGDRIKRAVHGVFELFNFDVSSRSTSHMCYIVCCQTRHYF